MTEPSRSFSLRPGHRILFLTKDPDLIRRQIAGELDLRMEDLTVEELLDDINTDVMTPAWVCFDHEPARIARNAYAGLIVDGQRLIGEGDLARGRFEVIVSGYRKGTGSSRETAVQAEKWSGIRLAIAASFAPIHARNNINQGVLMGDHTILQRLQDGESVPLEQFATGRDPITRQIIHAGGLFPFARGLSSAAIKPPPLDTPARPMTMAEKIIARHAYGDAPPSHVKPGDALLIRVDGGYSHEFTTAQVHSFLAEEYGADYQLPNPSGFAVFEDHLIYADGVPRMAPFADKIETLRQMQREFQAHTGVRDYSAQDGESPGICHQLAREAFIRPGDVIVATDSHTCMGGASNSLAFGVGATEYANLAHSGFTQVRVPESIRFELVGSLPVGCTAKDLMLYILWHHAREQKTLDRAMEFGGPGLAGLSMDERATLANMATECAAFTGIVEADETSIQWIATHQGADPADLKARSVHPDEGAVYDGGVHTIDLATLRPLVAHPGDPDRGIPSDPTNGAWVDELGQVKVDIAYGGSCTAGKDEDMDFYAKVCAEADAAGLRVADGTRFFLQFGSKGVADRSRRKGHLELFERVGVEIIPPGCGACIGCGPGVSETEDQVTVSAINRNFKGRSGPGRLYLASPLTVAASAFTGLLTAWRPGLFCETLQSGS